MILTSVIKSEPLDQSDGSDYTRNCEPWYPFFLVFFQFITSFFYYIFIIFTSFFLPLMHCVFTQVLFSFTSKNHKNIFYFLLLVFYYFIIIIYLVVIFTILFIYHHHLMHYFIFLVTLFFIIFQYVVRFQCNLIFRIFSISRHLFFFMQDSRM